MKGQDSFVDKNGRLDLFGELFRGILKFSKTANIIAIKDLHILTLHICVLSILVVFFNRLGHLQKSH